MNNLTNLFSPFKNFGPKTLLATGIAIFLIFVWITSPQSVLPSPLAIAKSWNHLALNEGLLHELFVSAMLIWKSIFYSTLISFSIAFLATTQFFKPVATWLTALRFLGFAGITYVFTLWFGGGENLKLSLMTFGMSVFLMPAALSMINNIKQDQIDYARTLHLDGWKITYELAFRDHLDESIDLIRQNAAMGWTLLSMVETLVRSGGGIGGLLADQNKHFQMSAVFAVQLTILVYGLLQDSGIQFLKSIVCPYTKFQRN